MACIKLALLLVVVHICHGLPYGDDNNDIYSNDDYEEVAANTQDEETNEKVIHTLPSFTSEGENLIVNEGSTIKLPCVVDRLEGFVLMWMRGKDFISVGNRLIDQSDSRMKLVKEPNGNSLTISLAEEEDAGEYTCQISTYDPIEIRYSVKIRVKPEVRPIPDNGIIVAETGDSVTLGCEVTRGNPPPEVRWRRRERKMPSGEDNLLGLSITYTAVTRHHSGVYICEADNGFGEPSVANLKLDVQHKPEIEQEETFIHTGEGDQTEVICIVHASPKAEVTWYKDGSPLDMSENVVNQRGNRHTLTISGTDKSKFGKYTCKAQNEYGEDEKTAEVSGLAEVAVVKSDPKGGEFDRFSMEWTARSLSPITNFRVEYKKLSDEVWSSQEADAYQLPNSDNMYTGNHMIPNLNPATVYLAKVSSRNAYGYSNYSQVFKFATRGADPIQKPITGSGAVPTHVSVTLTALCSLLVVYMLH